MRYNLLGSGTVALIVASGLAAGGGTDKELEKFHGAWKVVAAELKGQKASEEAIKSSDVQLIFAADKYTEKIKGKVTEDGTFKVDASKTPHELTLSIESGKDKGKTQLGLYKFEGDKLIVALARPGSEVRPTSFSTNAEGEFAVQVLAREKPADK